jgi:hypothetical protein
MNTALDGVIMDNKFPVSAFSEQIMCLNTALSKTLHEQM